MNLFQSSFYYATNKKLKNEIEDLFVKFNDEIEVYNEQYKLTLKSYISAWKNEITLLKANYEKERVKRKEIYNENISEDGDDQYALHISGLEYQDHEYYENENNIKDKYENYLDLYSKSILVALYSLNEIFLNKICDASSKRFVKKIKLSDFNSRDYLTTPVNYLNLVIGLNADNLKKHESKLKDIQFLRNKIIHAGSVIEEKKINEIVKKQRDKLEYDKLDEELKIKKSKFIKEFIYLLRNFHEEIFWMLEEKQGNQISKNCLKYFFGLIDKNILITNLKQIKASNKKVTIEFQISSRKRNFKKCNGRLIVLKSKHDVAEFLNQTDNEAFQKLSDYQADNRCFDLKKCIKGLTIFNYHTNIKLNTY